MRKRIKKKQLGRVKKQRTALFKSLATGLILNGKIKTTQAKAKTIRPIIEKMVTQAKKNTMAHKRLLRAKLSEQAVKKLDGEIAPKYFYRNGGYTRIINLPRRYPDGAKMAIIEFI